MVRDTRPIVWIKAARRVFEDFPDDVQDKVLRALTIVAEGKTPDSAKPMKGLGPGVLEFALSYRGDTFRVVYAVKIDHDIWVIHAFQKKSKSGIATPRHEIETIRTRLARLKEISK